MMPEPSAIPAAVPLSRGHGTRSRQHRRVHRRRLQREPRARAAGRGPCPAARFASGVRGRRRRTSAWRSPPRSRRSRPLDGPLEVVSDSTYVVNCFRDRWWEGWLKRGWLNSQKKPVANRDLWEPLDRPGPRRAATSTFRWVKGHSGDPMNDLVDRLAVEARDRPRRRRTRRRRARPSSAASPTTFGRAEAAAPARRRPGDGRRAPPGTRSLVLGPPPARARRLRRQPGRRRGAAPAGRDPRGQGASCTPTSWCVTGLRLGAELLGAEAARRRSACRFVAVLPYPDPDSVWPRRSQARFAALIDGRARRGRCCSARRRRRSRRPAPRWPAATRGSRATPTRRCSCGTATTASLGKPATGRSTTASATTVWVLDPPDVTATG